MPGSHDHNSSNTLETLTFLRLVCQLLDGFYADWSLVTNAIAIMIKIHLARSIHKLINKQTIDHLRLAIRRFS